MTNNDGWGTPWPTVPTPTTWPTIETKTGDGWSVAITPDATVITETPRGEYVEGPDAWPVNPQDAWPVTTLDDTRVLPEDIEHMYGPTDDERARAANSCMSIDPQTPWVVDVPDGELTLKEDYIPTVTENEATGFYVAYSQGILHCILAGPYTTVLEANVTKDRAWERFQADGAMALAFAKSGWNPSGLYVAEIPLKARRRGAYGLI